jgi:hypothetical protein
MPILEILGQAGIQDILSGETISGQTWSGARSEPYVQIHYGIATNAAAAW